LQEDYFSIRWEHQEKKRYYHVVCSKDLFGDWVLTKAWGGMDKSTGRVTKLFCTTYTEAKNSLLKISKLRSARGYYVRELDALQLSQLLIGFNAND